MPQGRRLVLNRPRRAKCLKELERVKEIEPSYAAWEGVCTGLFLNLNKIDKCPNFGSLCFMASFGRTAMLVRTATVRR
jgi:hypothetical protein